MPLPPAPTKRAALLAPDAYSLKASDASLDDFDDAAIERSIAEINEAIRRSSARKGSNP